MTIEYRIVSTLLRALVHDDGDAETEGFAERIAETLARSAIELGSLRFSRANEFEADGLGYHILVKSGVGVRGMLAFFESLLSTEDRLRRSGHASGSSDTAPLLVSVQEWLSTHPATRERIQSIRHKVDSLPASRRVDALDGRRGRPLDELIDWGSVRDALRAREKSL